MNPDDLQRTFEQKCLSALARREHSRAELHAKGEGLPAGVVQAVLDKLAEDGWQSDARFVGQYVRSKAGQGDGRLKIRQALRGKGVDEALLREAMEEIDWQEVAERVYAQKYPQRATSPAERAKRERFMAQRGFTFDEIKTVIKNHG